MSTRKVKLTLMEEVLLLGIKDEQVCLQLGDQLLTQYCRFYS